MKLELQQFKIRYIISANIWSGIISIFFVICALGLNMDRGIGAVTLYYLYNVLLLFFIYKRLQSLNIHFKEFVGTFPGGKGVELGILCVTYYLFAFTSEKLMFMAFNMEPSGLIEGQFAVSPSFANQLPIFIVGNLLLDPISTETIRILLLNRLTAKWNVNIAVVISAIVIGLIGFNKVFLVQEIVLGIILALLYIKTQSLLVPVLLKMAMGIIGLFPVILSGTLTTGLIDAFRGSSLSQLQELSGGLVIITVLSTVVLMYYIYNNWPSRNWGKEESKGIPTISE